MTSTLSPSAIHRIIYLIENDDRRTPGLFGYWYTKPELQRVNSAWKAINQLYMGVQPSPPLDFLSSLELALVLKGKIDDEDVRAIFAHGKPLEFWGYPRLLVSKVVEALSEPQKEPTYLDVTMIALSGLGATMSAEVWSEVYTAHLPCRACSAVAAGEERSIPRNFSEWILRSLGPNDTVDSAVKKFHVSSKIFRKHLTLGLYYQFTRGTAKSGEFFDIDKITIQLADKTCSAHGSLSVVANRSSITLLLLPKFASEVFGFLDRAHVGSLMLANRGFHDLLCQLKQRLPRRDCAVYWLTVRHLQRDLSHTDVRCLKVPYTENVADNCALIRRYLSNSHVAELVAPVHDFPFALKMIANLASRNFSVGRVELRPGAQRLHDYRSMDAVFDGLRMSDLYLDCTERRFVELVKTTDFFRLSTIQGLRKLKLFLSEPWNEDDDPTGHARSKSPLWVSGIYLLRNCEYYQVNYGTDRHLRSIERKTVRFCEDFERGEITNAAGHFQLMTHSSKGTNYAFNRENLIASAVKFYGYTHPTDPTEYFEWDVYRFRNAHTQEYLTACVGGNSPYHGTRTILHIVKGEVYPGASFAEF